MKIIVTLPNGEKLTQVFSTSVVTIGRGQKADFIVQDDSLSRVHAKIELISNEFFVTDLESTNGVLFDGKKITPNKRTPLATFLVLHLGPIECQISEGIPEEATSPETHYSNPTTVTSDDSTKVTKTMRSINRSALNAPPLSSTRKKKTNDSQFAMTVVIVLLGFGMVAYYQLSQMPEEVVEVPAPQIETRPVKKAAPAEKDKVVKNNFLRLQTYEKIALKKSCKIDFEICHSMQLSEEDLEGSYTEDKETFVFMKPARKLKNFPALEGKSDAPFLVTLDSFFSSPLYTAMKKNELQQVHLIIQNEEPRIIKVFRFYAPAYKENEKLIPALRDAMTSGDSALFWEVFNSQIKTKSY